MNTDTVRLPEVIVREVGLRDGLQGLPVLPTQSKLAWLGLEAEAGVPAFEVTSFVPAHILPQFADAPDMIAQGHAVTHAELSALVLNAKGAQRALDAGVRSLVFVLSASETHSARNARTTPEAALHVVQDLVAQVAGHPSRPRITGAIATAFGCTYEGRIPVERVQKLAEGLAQAGVDDISLGDTVGFAGPGHVRRLYGALRRQLGDGVVLGAHFHDTRGMGMANALAALDAGVTRFDASLGGLGGCPFAPGATGNIAMEDLCFLLDELGVHTGVDLEKLLHARHELARLLPDQTLHGALSRAGLPRTLAPAST